MKQQVISKKAAEPCSYYSQAIISNGTSRLYMSSLAPYSPDIDPSREIKEQTTLLIKNIRELLEENDFSLQDLVKINVYLKDKSDLTDFNKVYKKEIPQPWPARSVFFNSDLDDLVEIDLIAEK